MVALSLPNLTDANSTEVGNGRGMDDEDLPPERAAKKLHNRPDTFAQPNNTVHDTTPETHLRAQAVAGRVRPDAAGIARPFYRFFTWLTGPAATKCPKHGVRFLAHPDGGAGSICPTCHQEASEAGYSES